MYSIKICIFFICSFLLRGCRSDCSSTDSQEEIRELRLEHLKTNIRAQLGLTEIPEPPEPYPDEEDLDEETLSAYYEMVNATYLPAKCTTDEFYAKPIHSFIGLLSEDPVTRSRRAAEKEDELFEEDEFVEAGVLNHYTISLNFTLPVNQQDISHANLLLNQLTADTLNNDVVDEFMLVEIETVIRNVRYFVSKKKVSVYDYGLRSFDITRAAELWVDESSSGEVLLEVAVKCYSSLDCGDVGANGREPAKVAFSLNTTDISTQPRIITYSKNPLETDANHRTKRQAGLETEQSTMAPPTAEPVFCSANNSDFCCLNRLTIRFKEDLDMGFITKPKSFEANFCNGFCPRVSTLGVGTIERYQLLKFLSASPTNTISPCCSGLEYRPLQVVLSLYDPHKRRFTSKIDRLNQVTVTKCKCG